MRRAVVNRRAGFTVIEVLVYSALSIVLLGGISIYVNNGLRIYRGGNTYQTAQKDAMLTLRHVSNELTNSTFASEAGGQRIQLGMTPTPYVIFPSADGLRTEPDYKTWNYDQTNGELMWKKWVQISLDSNQRTLVRTEKSFNPTIQESMGIPPQFGDFPTPTIYGNNVTGLIIQWQEVGRVLEVSLTTETPPVTGVNQGTRVELRTSVSVEN